MVAAYRYLGCRADRCLVGGRCLVKLLTSHFKNDYYLVMYHNCKDGPQRAFREAQGSVETDAIRMLPGVIARPEHGMAVELQSGGMFGCSKSVQVDQRGGGQEPFTVTSSFAMTLNRPSRLSQHGTSNKHSRLVCPDKAWPHSSHKTFTQCCNPRPARDCLIVNYFLSSHGHHELLDDVTSAFRDRQCGP